MQWWDFILCCICDSSATFTPKPRVLKWVRLRSSAPYPKCNIFLPLARQPAASSESAFISLCTHTLMLSWQHFLWPYCPRVRFKSSWRPSPRPEQSSCSVSHLPGVPVSVRADPAVAVGSSLPVPPSLLLLRLARQPRPPALLSFRRTKVFSALTAFCGVLLSCCFEALGSAPFTPCALKIISIGLRTYFHLIRCFIFKVFPQQFYLKVWWLYCLNTHTHKKNTIIFPADSEELSSSSAKYVRSGASLKCCAVFSICPAITQVLIRASA